MILLFFWYILLFCLYIQCCLFPIVHNVAEVLSESFRDSPASITVLTHSPLTLTCYAPDPSPPPSLLWLINGVAFQPNDDRRTAQYDPTTGRSTFQFRRSVHRSSGIPHLPLVWWGHWLRVCLSSHGATLSRLREEVEAGVCHLPSSPGVHCCC